MMPVRQRGVWTSTGQHVSSAARSDARVLGGNPVAEDDEHRPSLNRENFDGDAGRDDPDDESNVASYIGRNQPQPVPN